MNKREVKKKLHLNNKEFQVLFRSGKKYFRYAIDNLCFAFGCSSYIGRYYISWPLTRTGITCIVTSRCLQVIWEQLKWRGLTMKRGMRMFNGNMVWKAIQ